MNKYILLLILPLLSFTLTGCDDEDDANHIPIALNLFGGNWEVVDPGNQELFERDCLLDITSSQIHEGYGGYQGDITTYYLTVGGTPIHDKVFTWSIRYVENHHPLLDVVFQGELDNDNVWDGNYHYRITKLTDTQMWWQVNTNGDNSTIKFKRRNDIHLE